MDAPAKPKPKAQRMSRIRITVHSITFLLYSLSLTIYFEVFPAAVFVEFRPDDDLLLVGVDDFFFAVAPFTVADAVVFLPVVFPTDARPFPAAELEVLPLAADPDFEPPDFATVFPPSELLADRPALDLAPPDLDVFFPLLPAFVDDDFDFEAEVPDLDADPAEPDLLLLDRDVEDPDELDLEEPVFPPDLDAPDDFVDAPVLDPPRFLLLSAPTVLTTAEAVPTAAPLAAPSAAP